MTRHALGPILAALLTATSALAQTGDEPQNRQNGAAPRKGVDLSRFQDRRRERMMRADTDHDGRVSQAEFLAWRSAHPGKEQAGGRQPDPEKRFHRLDADGDGFLEPDEIDAASARSFARLDADRDGSVTREERHPMRKP